MLAAVGSISWWERGEGAEATRRESCTFPTAASPSKTSFTLLLGLVAAAVASAMLLAGAFVVSSGRHGLRSYEGPQSEWGAAG